MLITNVECDGRVTRQSAIFELVPETSAELIKKRRQDDNVVRVIHWDLFGKYEIEYESEYEAVCFSKCAWKWRVQTLVELQCLNGSGN